MFQDQVEERGPEKIDGFGALPPRQLENTYLTYCNYLQMLKQHSLIGSNYRCKSLHRH